MFPNLLLPRFSLRRLIVAVAVSGCFMGGLPILNGAESAAEKSSAAEVDSVNAARKGLQAQKFPWYNPGTDSPRPLKVPPYTSTAEHGPVDTNRSSNWEWSWNTGTSSSSTPRTSLPNLTPTTGLWGFLSPLNALGILALLTAIGLICYFLVKAVMRDDEMPMTFELPETPAKPPELRISELPVTIPTTTGDFLSEIRRLAAEGKYGQAIIYLFSYELLQLDQHAVIRLAKGKTNRQYLREARPRPELRALLEPTMIAFEDTFFGKHEVDQARFETCWTKIDEFHRLLQGLPT